MLTYSKHRPTGFDPQGAFLPDRQFWLVVPVSQTRDSGPFDHSNFAAALALLGGESDTVEVHRFGHWGPGWYEIIIVDPASPEADIARDIESRLEDYPVLDDDDFSRREWDDYLESWRNWGASDFRRILAKMVSGPAAEALIDDADDDALMEFHESLIPSGEYYICESSGVSIRIHEPSRDQLATFLRQLRSA